MKVTKEVHESRDNIRTWEKCFEEVKSALIKENKALEESRECIWKEEKDIDSCNTYNTSCENMFEFVDGKPKNNNFKYCPYCGKVLKEKKTK